MKKSVDTLLPNVTPELQAEALLVTIAIFLVADYIRAPLSYTMSLAGLLAGLSFARGTFGDQRYLFEIVGMWIVAPLIAIVFVFYLLRAFHTSFSKNFWNRLKIYKVLIILFSFSSAYVLGANTLGLIVATGGSTVATTIAAVVAIFVGSFYLSAGEIKRVSEELFLMRYSNTMVTLFASTFLVETATFLNIPLSNTQTLSAAVFGAAISYKSRFVSLRPFLVIVSGWIVAPLISFILGFLIR